MKNPKNRRRESQFMRNKYLYLGLLLLLIFSFNAPAVFAADATLAWDAPTTNTDGTPIEDLAGYWLYYGTSSGYYSNKIDIGNVMPYTVSNLSEGYTYYFAVTAYDTSGNESSSSNEVSKTIQPPTDTSPPAINIIQIASVTESSATITWMTDEPSTSQVEYGLSTTYGSLTSLDSSLTTSHSVTITGLSSNTTYNFRVRSKDAAGNEAVSRNYTFTTSNIPPAVSSLSANPSIGVAPLQVAFAASASDPDGNIVTYDWDFDGDGLYDSSTTANTISYTYATAGTYTAIVKVTDDRGATATGQAIITAESGSLRSVTLSWDAPTTNTDGTPLTDIAGYKVYYGTEYGNYTQNIDVGNVTTYKVANLTEGLTYYFAVTAYDTSANESTYSNDVSTSAPSTDTSPPAINIIQIASVTESSATITWMTDEPSTSQIEYGLSTTYGSLTSLDSSLTTSHSVTITGLSSNTTYNFRVRSKDAAGNEAVSTNYTFTTSAPADTVAPSGSITINGGADYTNITSVTLDLSATDVSGVTEMIISNDGVFDTEIPEPYATSKTWTLTAGDGKKTVYVKFKDSAGNWSSAYSDAITLDSSAPTTTASPGGGLYNSAISVTLTPDETAAIYYTLDGTTPTTLSSAYSNPISLTTSTTLRFFAVDSAGNLEPIKSEIYTIDIMPPVISNIQVTNISRNSATITWTTDEPSTSQIEYGLSTTYGSLTPIDYNLVTVHSVKITGLSKSSIYNFRVRSKDAAGNEALSGNYTFTTSSKGGGKGGGGKIAKGGGKK
jgi:hypothetical protein